MAKVSIILPTYNSARFISATIQSVLDQTYRDFELIVVDDGSTDNTREVLQPFIEQIKYIYQTNAERSAARNNGLKSASGEYIAFIDSDDLWARDKLQQQVDVLDAHPEVSLIFCQARYIDEKGEPVAFCGDWIEGPPADQLMIADYYQDLLGGNVVSGGGSTPVVRAWMLRQSGLFDVHITHGEDWDVWLRLARLGPFAYLPVPLASYRVYGWKKLLTRQSTEEAVQQHLRVLEKNLPSGNLPSPEYARLRDLSERDVYILAALGNYMLENYERGKKFLRLTVERDAAVGTEDGILWLAVDRAKIIERDTGSYEEACVFISNVLNNLPSELSHLHISQRKAQGWLYISGAFEQFKRRNDPAARRLVMRGIAHHPGVLSNKGVVSMLVQTTFGRPLVENLQKLLKR